MVIMSTIFIYLLSVFFLQNLVHSDLNTNGTLVYARRRNHVKEITFHSFCKLLPVFIFNSFSFVSFRICYWNPWILQWLISYTSVGSHVSLNISLLFLFWNIVFCYYDFCWVWLYLGCCLLICFLFNTSSCIYFRCYLSVCVVYLLLVSFGIFLYRVIP